MIKEQRVEMARNAEQVLRVPMKEVIQAHQVYPRAVQRRVTLKRPLTKVQNRLQEAADTERTEASSFSEIYRKQILKELECQLFHLKMSVSVIESTLNSSFIIFIIIQI